MVAMFLQPENILAIFLEIGSTIPKIDLHSFTKNDPRSQWSFNSLTSTFHLHPGRLYILTERFNETDLMPIFLLCSKLLTLQEGIVI